MTKKDLLQLICLSGGFYILPVFRRYLGTFCDQKGFVLVN